MEREKERESLASGETSVEESDFPDDSLKGLPCLGFRMRRMN